MDNRKRQGSSPPSDQTKRKPPPVPPLNIFPSPSPAVPPLNFQSPPPAVPPVNIFAVSSATPPVPLQSSKFPPSQLTGRSLSGSNLFTLDSLRSPNSPFSSARSKSKSRPHSQFSHQSPAPHPPLTTQSDVHAAAAAAEEESSESEAEEAAAPYTSAYVYNLDMMRKWCKDGKNTSFPTAHQIYGTTKNFVYGVIYCKACKEKKVWDYDLMERLPKLAERITKKIRSDPEVRQCVITKQAPSFWCEPKWHKCRKCEGQRMIKSVVAEKEEEINYLYLFLSEHLAFCTVDQLHYFIKHNTPPNDAGIYVPPSPFTKPHLLYCCYKEIFMQLWPKLWTFDDDANANHDPEVDSDEEGSDDSGIDYSLLLKFVNQGKDWDL